MSESSGPASSFNYLTISINGLNEYIAGRLPWAGVTVAIILFSSKLFITLAACGFDNSVDSVKSGVSNINFEKRKS